MYITNSHAYKLWIITLRHLANEDKPNDPFVLFPEKHLQSITLMTSCRSLFNVKVSGFL